MSQIREYLPRVLLPFFTLSYPVPRPEHPDSFFNSNYYGRGVLDIFFAISWVAVLAILREFLRLGILEPFARTVLYRLDMKEHKTDSSRNAKHANGNGKANGHSNGHAAPAKAPPKPLPIDTTSSNPSQLIVRKRPKGMDKVAWKRERSTLRFAEQGWQFAYYIVYWPLGFYIHYNFPSAPFNLDKLWLNYPHTPLAGPLKFYYLTQLGFWFHQVLLLNAEARRKDHVQMMSHHVITITLVIASYWCNFTRVGVLVMVLMDFCDIFLAFAKMCRYLRVPALIMDSVFAFFAFSWIITRNILFGIVIYSAYKKGPELLQFKWDPENGSYITYTGYVAFVSLLLALQALLFLWTVMLLRIIWNVLGGNPPDDSRSDEESDSEPETKKSQ